MALLETFERTTGRRGYETAQSSVGEDGMVGPAERERRKTCWKRGSGCATPPIPRTFRWFLGHDMFFGPLLSGAL